MTTNEAIEAAARAMCEMRDGDDIFWEDFTEYARAAAPALMEEGARLALEAAKGDAYNAYLKLSVSKVIWDAMAALDPAAIVKGAGRE